MSDVPVGIYRDMPFAEYAAIDAINSGIVRWGFKATMRHMLAAREGRIDNDDTKDRKFGRAIHCRLLEPERYRTDFLIATKCVATVKSQKHALCGNSARYVSPIPTHEDEQRLQVDHCLRQAGWELRTESDSGSRYYVRNEKQHVRVSDHPPNDDTRQWMDNVRCASISVGLGENVMAQLAPFTDGETFQPLQFWYCGVKGHAPTGAVEPTDFIDENEAAANERIAEALRTHPAMKLFRRQGWSEVSMVWELCGLKCKCRIDKLDDWEATDKPLVIDIKSCQVGDASREDCEKAIANNGYHRQAALNVNAVEALTGKRPGFVWVFIEKGEPFDVQIVPADDETLAIGLTEVRRTLELYRSAEAKGDFRGYIYDPRFIGYGGLPGWYRQRYADDDGVPRSGTGAEIGAECAF